jgi:hypothetical protein
MNFKGLQARCDPFARALLDLRKADRRVALIHLILRVILDGEFVSIDEIPDGDSPDRRHLGVGSGVLLCRARDFTAAGALEHSNFFQVRDSSGAITSKHFFNFFAVVPEAGCPYPAALGILDYASYFCCVPRHEGIINQTSTFYRNMCEKSGKQSLNKALVSGSSPNTITKKSITYWKSGR